VRLPECLRRVLLRRCRAIMAHRSPDIVIGPPQQAGDVAYLSRWYAIPRNRWCNVYIHHFTRSDDHRALHDHPWASCSILLDGGYIEHLPGGIAFRPEGSIVCRAAATPHRVQLYRQLDSDAERPVITLFLTGPRVREWGFHCPAGWRHWRDFTAGSHGERVGRGCE
jgi:hypothetical protein